MPSHVRHYLILHNHSPRASHHFIPCRGHCFIPCHSHCFIPRRGHCFIPCHSHCFIPCHVMVTVSFHVTVTVSFHVTAPLLVPLVVLLFRITFPVYCIQCSFQWYCSHTTGNVLVLIKTCHFPKLVEFRSSQFYFTFIPLLLYSIPHS